LTIGDRHGDAPGHLRGLRARGGLPRSSRLRRRTRDTGGGVELLGVEHRFFRFYRLR
jgi:hypothetical protein